MLVDGALWPEESTSPTGQPVLSGGGGAFWMIMCACLCVV